MKTKYKWLALSLLSAAALLVFNIVTASVQQESINTKEASAILQELKNIREILQRIENKTTAKAQAVAPTKPKIAEISSVNRPSLGSSNAPVTIVEVSDYQCPFCKRFADSTLRDLKKNYIDTGKVRLVFKDMPLPFHNNAKKAAQAAHCAGEQDKYWKMHDQLFSNVNKLDNASLMVKAKKIKLDIVAFKACINSKRHFDKIEKDIADVAKAGLSGTPSFVIGKTEKDIIKGDVIVGALPLSGFKKYIEKHL